METNAKTMTVNSDEHHHHHHRHHHHRHKYFRPAIVKMRIILLVCSILYTYGAWVLLGDLNGVIFGFSFPALYIISGYLVLRRSRHIEERIKRAIGRTATCFFILFMVFVGMSFLVEPSNTAILLRSKSFWANFLMLNICNLPIGSTIWFVQALLYAYIVIYFIYKWKLLNFDIYIAALCLAITLITGELSSVFGFEFLGHTYLGGNFLTRALPYILIGHFINRKKRVFSKIKQRYYWMIIIIGAVLTALEYLLLNLSGNKTYIGHLVGMGLVAVGIVFFCLFKKDMKVRSKVLKPLSRYELMIPFFVCSPIFYAICRLSNIIPAFIIAIAGMLTALLSVVALYFYAYLKNLAEESEKQETLWNKQKSLNKR